MAPEVRWRCTGPESTTRLKESQTFHRSMVTSDGLWGHFPSVYGVYNIKQFTISYKSLFVTVTLVIITFHSGHRINIVTVPFYELLSTINHD